jgi:hypothetical protein
MFSMSIATMKAKSLTMYGKTHSTKDGFSLNGPLRQPSLKENLGRSVTRTPFRGPAPMGHGMGSRCRLGGWRARTCGASYPIHIHRSSLGTPQTLVKRSTMNEKGLLETKYTGILHGVYPRTHVYKVDKEAGGYVQTVGRSVLSCPISTKDYVQSSERCTPYTKTLLDMDYSRYNRILTATCQKNDLLIKV